MNKDKLWNFVHEQEPRLTRDLQFTINAVHKKDKYNLYLFWFLSVALWGVLYHLTH